jgi:hypothetical protein
MSRRRRIERAILRTTGHPRQAGEVYARVGKVLGGYDADDLRRHVFGQVSRETRRRRRRQRMDSRSS